MGIETEWTDPSAPLYAELAPLVEAGLDSDAADVMNRRDRTGYVPRRHIAATLARHAGVYGLARWVRDGRTMPSSLAGPVAVSGLPVADFSLYALFAAILLVVEFDDQAPLKAGVLELGAGLKSIPTALVPQSFRDDLFAGEVKLSRAEEVVGRNVTAFEIGTIRNGGK